MVVAWLAVPQGVKPAITFADVTESSGLADTTLTFGAAWTDFDGDGHLDLWVCHHNVRRPSLFRNRGDGTFVDQTKERFPRLKVTDFHGSAFGDFDSDGDPDLVTLVGAEHGEGALPKLLFVNEGARFVERAAEFGLDDLEGRGRTPLWLDWDQDGRLDVIYANKPRDDGASPTTLFLQREGKFERGRSFDDHAFRGNRAHAQLCDLEFDGKPELLFVFMATASLLRIGEPAGEGESHEPLTLTGGMDVIVADLDNDGLCEIVAAGSMRKTGIVALRVRGRNVERQVLLPKFPSTSLAASIGGGDFDNDGDVDLFFVTGSADTNDPDVLVENHGGTFSIVPNGGGAAGATTGLGDTVAVADYDRDGFLDLFVTNGRNNEVETGPCLLFRNTSGARVGDAGHWLAIDLEGTASNRDGIGAVVTVRAGGKSQRRFRSGGMHAFTQDSARLHFGLGTATKVDELEVRWPRGIVQVLRDVPADQVLRVKETPP